MTRNEQQLHQQVTFLNQANKALARKLRDAEAIIARIQDDAVIEQVTANVRVQRKAQQVARHALVSASAMAESE